MNISIETLKKVSGIGKKTLDRVIEQHNIDNNINQEQLYVGEKAIGYGLHNTSALDVLKNVPDKSIDLIVTDPPYKTTARGSAGNSGGMLQKEINRKGQVFEFNDIKPEEYLPQFYRVLKDDSHFYIMTNHINLQNMINTATNCGFHFIKSLIWSKGNKIMGRAYMSEYEYILFFRKSVFKGINECGTSDILSIPNKKTKDPITGLNLYDTEKPVELMEILIRNSTQEGEVVADFFAGIGSVELACNRLNRKFIGTEIDVNYYEISNKRTKGEI